MKAKTDAGPTIPNSEMTEEIKNIFTILDVVSSKDTVDYYKEKYASCEIRYGDLKKQLAEDIIQSISPIRERILEIRKDNNSLNKVARLGAEKARESAQKTLKEVREVMGFRHF